MSSLGFRFVLARLAICGAVVGALVGCGGDGGSDGTVATTTSVNRVNGEAADARLWHGGRATLELDGDRWEFVLNFCAVQAVAPDADTDTVTLQVAGATSDAAETVTLAVVETVTNKTPARIQVISVHFEATDGTRLRTLEAQRVVDIETGEVDDLHGDATTPLFDVEQSDQLSVSATEAVFWQFDMSGGDDRVVGAGDLQATCSASR